MFKDSKSENRNNLIDHHLPSVYKSCTDSRSNNQIFLSNQIVRLISQINLQRIRDKADLIHKHLQFIKNDNSLFFMCLTGIPNFINQYKSLELPGQAVVYTITGLSQTKQYSQQQFIRIYKQLSFDIQANNIHKIVNEEAINKNKKVIIIFHSFGSFVLDAYLSKYGCDTQAIIGFIDLAGIPITMYYRLKYSIKFLLQINNRYYQSFQQNQRLNTFLLQNAQIVYKNYIQYAENIKKNQIQLMKFQNKYRLIIFLKYVSSSLYHQIFNRVRSYPKILKLFLAGQKDVIFQQSLLNQKFIYYCQQKISLEQNQIYKKSLVQSYHKMHNKIINIDQLQQKYMINFRQGKHSIHMQQKIIPHLKLVVNQYIVLVWQAYCIRKQLMK